MNERIRTTAVPPLPGGAWQRHGVSSAHLQGRLTWPPLWVSSALPDATSFPPLLASPLPTCASQASVLGPRVTSAVTTPTSMSRLRPLPRAPRQASGCRLIDLCEPCGHVWVCTGVRRGAWAHLLPAHPTPAPRPAQGPAWSAFNTCLSSRRPQSRFPPPFSGLATMEHCSGSHLLGDFLLDVFS